MATRLPILEPARTDPDRDVGRLQRLAEATEALKAGDRDKARAMLESVRAECGDSPKSWMGAQAALFLAAVDLLDGAPADALARLEVMGDTPLADSGFPMMLAASALCRLGRLDEALQRAERALEHGVTPSKLLVLADVQKHAGMLADAIATLDRLLTDNPEDENALGQLAGYLYLASDRMRAVEIEQRFEARAPDNFESDRARAFIALTRADLDAALASLDRAYARDAKGARAYVRDEVELARFNDDARVMALRLR